MSNNRPVVIMMTSNGVGMGHLSRQVTTALSGPQRFDAVIFSLSRALPRVVQAAAAGDLPGAIERGIRFEYGPSWESGWPSNGWRGAVRRRWRSYRWAPYLRDRIVALAQETGAQALVFDGVAPYAGLLQARRQLPTVRFAWVRRGLWRLEAPQQRLDASRYFDLTIEPGDLASGADRGPTRDRSDSLRLAHPVSLTDVLPPFTRAEARDKLGLPQDRPALLLAPGSGALGSVDTTIAAVLETMASEGPDWVVTLTRQSIATHTHRRRGVVTLEDVYPLSRYLNAFDAAVGAAGYNGVHELAAAGVPTLLIPSTAHATDDQEARAMGAASRRLALRVETTLADAVRTLLSTDVRDMLGQALTQIEPARGGCEIAAQIASLAGEGAPSFDGPHRASPPVAIPDLRRRAPHGSSNSLLFTEAITAQLLRGNRPVEHLVAGSSTQYRRARESIAEWLYRT